MFGSPINELSSWHVVTFWPSTARSHVFCVSYGATANMFVHVRSESRQPMARTTPITLTTDNWQLATGNWPRDDWPRDEHRKTLNIYNPGHPPSLFPSLLQGVTFATFECGFNGEDDLAFASDDCLEASAIVRQPQRSHRVPDAAPM